MQKSIANVITNSNKLELGFKYNKCKGMEEIDKLLPTLIIGYNNAKKYIKNFNILKKYYKDDNIWWTFNKTEKRAIYDKDIVDFNSAVIKSLVKDVTYQAIDILTIDKETKIKFYNYLLSNKEKYIYNNFNKFLFIYDLKNKIIYGLSLTTLRYLGKDTKKLLSKIYENKSNKMITDLSNIPINVKKQIGNDFHYQVALYEYFC